jgi:hypothetical protein
MIMTPREVKLYERTVVAFRERITVLENVVVRSGALQNVQRTCRCRVPENIILKLGPIT